MKTVNHYFLDALLSPLTGMADDDEMVKSFTDIDPNNESQIKDIIKTFLLPYFLEKNRFYREISQDTLAYYLTTSKIDFSRKFYSCLLPFAPPSEAKQFFIWIWEIFFPNETYLIEDISECAEKEDLDELHKLSVLKA